MDVSTPLARPRTVRRFAMDAVQKEAANNRKKKVHRRKWLTLEEKLRIIESNEGGKTSTRIARELGMNESSVRSILRKKDLYKSLGTTKSLHRFKSFARCRSLILDRMEKRLTSWIEENNQKRVQLTETDIQKKALALFNELKPEGECGEKFSASRGWFYRFKNRVNLQNCVLSGEKPPPDKAIVEEFQQEFAKLVEEGGYTSHQIFNVEETSLYWKRMPSQSFLLENEKNLQGYKPSKDALTLVLGGNAAGDLKLKPMIVYRSETPSALRDYDKDTLPIIWRSNKKAWLSKELFEEWFTSYFCPTVETYCHTRGLEPKVLLLLESSRSHDALSCRDNVRVVYLPENTGSVLQPMTVGVFPVLKANYLRKVLSQAVSSSQDISLGEFWSNYNIKRGIENIHDCWCEISGEDLCCSWRELLPEVKVKDFESQVGEIVKDVVTMGQYLGLDTIDIENVHECIESRLPKCGVVEFEEVNCKEETCEMFEEENRDWADGMSVKDLENILKCIDGACETIAGCDSNVERSIKVRQVLQNGIEPYRELYLAKSK